LPRVLDSITDRTRLIFLCNPNNPTGTLIDREVQSVNNNFSRAESIKNFTILEKELDQDDDELTATMKVRREMIEKRYKELIDKMY